MTASIVIPMTKQDMIDAAKMRWKRMGMVKQQPCVVIDLVHPKITYKQDPETKQYKPVNNKTPLADVYPDVYAPPVPRTRMRTMKEILTIVADEFQVEEIHLMSKRRTLEITLPRHVAMYLGKQCTHQSFPQIGRFFNRDHTTVLHGVGVVERRMREDAKFHQLVNMLRSRIAYVPSTFVYWGA